MKNLKNLDGLSVVAIDLDIWSGQTKLEDLDLSLQEGYNNEVVKLGNKRLVSRKVLRPFDRIKSAVRRQMLRRGIPFLTGYAIPAEQLEECVNEIEKLKAEFNDAVTEFLTEYEKSLQEWIDDNPNDEQVIRRGALPLTAVAKRFGFTWDAFSVQSSDHEKAKENLDSTTGKLGTKLIDSIQETALDFWDRVLSGRTSVGITCHITLREMKGKLEGLSFLDSRSKPLIELLDRVIAQSELPESKCGRDYVEPFFSQLTSAVLILADKKRMEQYLQGYSQSAIQPTLLEATTAHAATAASPAVAAEQEPAPETSDEDFFAALDIGVKKDVVTSKPTEAKAEVVEEEKTTEIEAVVEAKKEVAQVETKAEIVEVQAVVQAEVETLEAEVLAPVTFGLGDTPLF